MSGRDDSWLMGALVDQGAYDPEADRLLPPPRSPAAIPLPVERAIGRGLKAADYYVGLPSRVMGGVANPYPEGSDLAQARENIDLDARQRWGASTGFGMVFDPLALMGVKPGVPGTTLGSGITRYGQPAGASASGEIRGPVTLRPALAGVSEQQQARLGPMMSQLEKLGATPEQIARFSPKEAYDFIRARNMRMGDVAREDG